MSATKELETAVRALRASREQKKQDIVELDRSIADFIAVLAKLPEELARAQELGDITDRFVNLSVPKAAEVYLLDVKRGPAAGREIAEALLRGGIRTTSNRFEAVVYSRLQESTSPKFRRTPDSRGWWLADLPLETGAWGIEDAPASAMGAKVQDGAVR